MTDTERVLKACGKYADRVQDVEHWREEGSGPAWYDVRLARGWQIDGTHVVYEHTLRAVAREVRRAEPCNCAECS